MPSSSLWVDSSASASPSISGNWSWTSWRVRKPWRRPARTRASSASRRRRASASDAGARSSPYSRIRARWRDFATCTRSGAPCDASALAPFGGQEPDLAAFAFGRRGMPTRLWGRGVAGAILFVVIRVQQVRVHAPHRPGWPSAVSRHAARERESPRRHPTCGLCGDGPEPFNEGRRPAQRLCS